MSYLWIDTDAGLDDTVAILMALQHSTVLGISCSYGNIPCDYVKKNVSRVVNMYKQVKGLKVIPKLTVSALNTVSKFVPKPLSEPDEECWHGIDGLGGQPDFEKKHNVPFEQLPFEEFMPSLLWAAAEAKKNGQKLKFISIGPCTTMAELEVENMQYFTMSACIPEAFASLDDAKPFGPTDGNMGVFKCPFAEHNIACDVDAAEKCFREKDIVVADWVLTIKKSLTFDTLNSLHKGENKLQDFHQAISAWMVQQTKKINGTRYMICDALAVFAAIFPEFCTLRQCGIEVITEQTEQFGRTKMVDGKNIGVIVDLEYEQLLTKLRAIFDN
ncbi:Inosine-uridine nucleoside N-ribohydrolase [Spironucleus salmonicida]|uniref:Inosine-uridine nucleoside N-ribohydrolase n=1 Tax=Spironucleus salmonicida TaxID=348837 RepID=V6LMS4_9EUKA|nr:Inosine-uridine nucleoside N-ribohydrolase [Spironucleus salmonicida]|eukprot:EST42019.1 Inosine-uridine nucleoside N-ribohydrolase [Spironucleus salmonicida]